MSVLVTGGTGAFGQAFVKRLLKDYPGRICIYSRDEWKQAQMRIALGDDERLRFFIGDVRDKERLSRAMNGIDNVVAAAALKRIEVGNYAPDEMVKTNIIGAMNTIDAAYEKGVKKVIALSTDKAYQPVSPYGQSKALAESLFLNANNIYGQNGPKYSCVRYGNVWNSTGSVVPVWRRMIENGAKKLPVTDPDCTRFFMLLEEAVALVAHAMVDTTGNELIIPDWLPAYRLGDLAEAFGREMEVTGLPTWEKKHECMSAGLCSNTARPMTVEELEEHINDTYSIK